MWAVTPCLTAPATDRALAPSLITNSDILEGRAMSPEAAVVGLAVVLCIVEAIAAGDGASAGLLGGGLGHYPLIVHFLYTFVKELY